MMRGERVEKKLSQKKAAHKIGISYRHYQDIERGKVDVRFATLDRVMKFFGIKYCELD